MSSIGTFFIKNSPFVSPALTILVRCKLTTSLRIFRCTRFVLPFEGFAKTAVNLGRGRKCRFTRCCLRNGIPTMIFLRLTVRSATKNSTLLFTQLCLCCELSVDGIKLISLRRFSNICEVGCFLIDFSEVMIISFYLQCSSLLIKSALQIKQIVGLFCPIE